MQGYIKLYRKLLCNPIFKNHRSVSAEICRLVEKELEAAKE